MSLMRFALKSHVGTVDTRIGIDVQRIGKKHTVKKHVRSEEEESRCNDDDVDVCLGTGSDDSHVEGSQDV